PPGRIEGDVVRTGDLADLRLVEAVVIGLRIGGVTGDQHHPPGERQRGRVPAVLVDTDDVAELVVRPGVGLVDLRRGTPGVVGQRYVDRAGDRVRLDVFGTVHLRRVDGVGGQPGERQHLLDAHAVDLALAVDHEREPLTGAVEQAVLGRAVREFRAVA